MTNRKTEVFEAYGPDVDAALRNWQQIDGPGYEAFARAAVGRQYLADYRRWANRNTINVIRPEPASDRLFTPPPAAPEPVKVRANLVHDGAEVALLDLAGEEGAAVIRRIASRDRLPAATTLARCDQYRAIADLIEKASLETGRPVSVREVLGRAA